MWLHTTLWGYVTTLHDFGGVLGWPLDTFFQSLTISWSRLLAHVRSDPKVTGLVSYHLLRIRAQHFPSNLYPYPVITISNDLCPPMLFKLRPCIQKLCNVYYSPTTSLGWIRQIKSRSLSLASAQSAYWLAYSLHLRSLTPSWSWMQCTNPMSTHEQ
jgi:hypothetical protein